MRYDATRFTFDRDVRLLVAVEEYSESLIVKHTPANSTSQLVLYSFPAQMAT